MTRSLLSLAAVCCALRVLPCSCFGPSTFCGTLDPDMPNPEYWIPDAVVRGVRVVGEAYGFDMRILEVMGGSAVSEGDVVRVWGDCGFTCRLYPDTWNDGDTIVCGLRYSDLQGNFVCGSELEVATDFMISICGVYALTYDNGTVTGPILTAEGETMTLDEFRDVVSTCLSVGITEHQAASPLRITYVDGRPTIALPEAGASELMITDALGRVCVRQGWNGTERVLDGLAAGTYVVQARRGDQRWIGRVMMR